MAKTLYLIRGPNDGGRADQIVSALNASGLPFTPKMYGIDPIPFSQISTIPFLAIVVDGQLYKGYEDRPGAPYNHAQLVADWNAAPASAPPPAPDVINPPVTRQQATTILKSLLENPPTGANPWTALQRDQFAYLMLLGLFRDLKNGGVY
jgi:hypothetical protein